MKLDFFIFLDKLLTQKQNVNFVNSLFTSVKMLLDYHEKNYNLYHQQIVINLKCLRHCRDHLYKSKR